MVLTDVSGESTMTPPSQAPSLVCLASYTTRTDGPQLLIGRGIPLVTGLNLLLIGFRILQLLNHSSNITSRNRFVRRTFGTLPHEFRKDDLHLLLNRFKMSLDDPQSLLRRNDRFDNLLDDPDEGVFFGVNVVESEALVLAVVANEPFRCRDER